MKFETKIIKIVITVDIVFKDELLKNMVGEIIHLFSSNSITMIY